MQSRGMIDIGKTHYDVLGVSNDATEVDIKRCFRKLSLELHPDRNAGNETRYTQIVEAYEVLGDAEKRRLYDMSLREHIVSRAVTRKDDDRSSNRVHRNDDDEYDDYGRRYRDERVYYDANDDEAVSGRYDRRGHYDGETHRYNKYSMIRQDRGVSRHRARISTISSTRASTRNEPRDYDDGKTVIDDVQHTLNITLEESYTGVSVPINIKRVVNGIEEEAKLYVDVPPGTDNGEIIILEGKGNVDAELRMRTHVRVRVMISKNEVFHRDGLNIVYSMEITLKEALCGFKKELTHLDGKTYVVGSEQGRVIGQGSRRVIPHKGFQRGHTVGNLVIVFSIVMPKVLTSSQIDVLSKIL